MVVQCNGGSAYTQDQTQQDFYQCGQGMAQQTAVSNRYQKAIPHLSWTGQYKSRKSAELVKEEIVEKANSEAQTMLETAKREIELSRDKALEDIQSLAEG